MAQFESTSMECPGKRKRRSVVEEDDEDFDVESYFANYVPLSNLPTPPAAKPSISAGPILPADAANDELLGKALQFVPVLPPPAKSLPPLTPPRSGDLRH